MLESLMTYITTFTLFFTILSLIRVGINFFTALLSNTPRKMEIGRNELIYYGFCLSYIITFLIYAI